MYTLKALLLHTLIERTIYCNCVTSSCFVASLVHFTQDLNWMSHEKSYR